MNKEFPCICGHLSEDHVSRPYDGKLYCDVRDPRKGRFIDDCIEYIPSNINYLESLVCKGEKKMKKKCKHPDFWFDRTIAYCPYCKEEHMDSICNDCNKSACEIAHGGRV